MLQDGDAATPKTFIWELARRSPQHKELLMTIAQKLKQEGRVEGIQIGEANGLKKGKLEVARTMLVNGLDRATVMKMTGLSDKDLTQIHH
ncbi:transposase [Yersinia aldovae]|uniref:Transposase n=1 Tax=Yersinia aldovae TaxID=29483 RepID=A0ABM9SWW9_YERAL|nr:transposase [Yersinia aldovae]